MWSQPLVRKPCSIISPSTHQTWSWTRRHVQAVSRHITPFPSLIADPHRKCRCSHRIRQSVASASSPSEENVETPSPGLFTIPTLLTLLRVVAIPALVAAWYASMWTLCFWLFVGASITDFFDGYLARAWNCSTPFGAFLDPVADKLMVATILILIGTVPIPSGTFAGNTWILPVIACIIIAREITMSALREWGATLGPEAHSAVAVNALGKYKTSSQMASLVLLLGAKTHVVASQQQWLSVCTDAGMALLCIAAFLTVSSVVTYFKGLWKYMV